jgi:butyryl-CoA dehydrogenase
MRTTARLEGGEWVIDGSKSFITNSGTDITSLVTVLAITGERPGAGGDQAGRDRARDGKPAGRGGDGRGRAEISAIVVPAGTAGFTVGSEYSKVGWCASDTRELAFSGCRVPADHLLGERGRGYAQFLEILDEGRIAIAAMATGLAAGCVAECLRQVRER